MSPSSFLRYTIELDRHSWEYPDFRAEKTAALMDAWLSGLSSQQFSNGAVLPSAPKYRRVHHVVRMILEFQAVLGLRLGEEWPEVYTDFDDHGDANSTGSCRASSICSTTAEDDFILNYSCLPSRPKRKRTNENSDENLDMPRLFLFDQIASHQPWVPNDRMQTASVLQDIERTMSPSSSIPIRGAKRMRVDAVDALQDNEPQTVESQSLARHPGIGLLETQNLDGSPDRPLVMTNSLPNSSGQLLKDIGHRLMPTDSITDETFDRLWPYCTFHSYDPDGYNEKACNTKRQAISHVVSHLVHSHQLIRGSHYLSPGVCIKYLTHCTDVSCKDSPVPNPCGRCSLVFQWTGAELAELSETLHSGPSLCLRCYKTFGTRRDLWLHIKGSKMCFDLGQTLSKSSKARLLYMTFCSAKIPPRWAPVEKENDFGMEDWMTMFEPADDVFDSSAMEQCVLGQGLQTDGQLASVHQSVSDQPSSHLPSQAHWGPVNAPNTATYDVGTAEFPATNDDGHAVPSGQDLAIDPLLENKLELTEGDEPWWTQLISSPA